MYNQINFSGINLATPDHQCNHGELSVLVGGEVHNGAIRPSVISGECLGSIDETANLLFVHNPVGGEAHYIADREGSLIYYLSDGDTLVAHDINYPESAHDIKSISAVGNTMCVLRNDGTIRYLVWLEQDGVRNYHLLDEKPPMLNIGWRLSHIKALEHEQSDEITETAFFDKSYAAYRTTDLHPNAVFERQGATANIKEEYRSAIADAAFALKNTADAKAAENSLFTEAFCVRYCYRLFDGSMFMHSQPVYLSAWDEGMSPVYVLNLLTRWSGVTTKEIVWGDGYTFSELAVVDSLEPPVEFKTVRTFFAPNNVVLRYVCHACQLEYRLQGDFSILQAELMKWKDIIQSVDIFVTPGISHLTTERIPVSASDHAPGYRWDGGTAGYYNLFGSDVVMDKTGYGNQIVALDIPELSPKEYADRINAQGAYFKIKSIKLSELAGMASLAYQPISIDKAVLSNLTVQEQMDDDYKTHNSLIASGQYIYNHKLHLYGLQEQLFSGMPVAYSMPNVYAPDESTKYYIHELRVKINTPYGSKVVSAAMEYGLPVFPEFFNVFPFVYPDARAEALYVVYSEGTREAEQKLLEIPMEAHSALNAATTRYHSAGTLGHDEKDPADYPVSENALSPLPSRIYSSPIDNPFYFPLSGIVTVGSGDIIALAATTTALSQGQFGQFPLMAFCSDGIWAIEVAGDGNYSSIRPISREVITSPHSLCQLDQSVIFISANGCQLLQGSEVRSLSDVLNGVYKPSDDPMLTLAISIDEHPIQFLQHAHPIADTCNQRVIFVDTYDSPLAMVLNTDTFSWSYMILPDDAACIPGYPYAFLSMTKQRGAVRIKQLFCLSKPYDYLDTDIYPVTLVTRPLSFGEVYYSLVGFRHAYNIASGNSHVAFYGSNNLINWVLLGTSDSPYENRMQGNTYRYFRVVLYADMRTSEQYLSLTLDIREKFHRL